MKVDVAMLDFSALIVLMVSVDVKQHLENEASMSQSVESAGGQFTLWAMDLQIHTSSRAHTHPCL